jgi:integrase
MAASTGARRGEILGLRWRNLDLDSGRAAIVETLISVRDVPTFSTPKTEKARRSIVLDKATVETLRAHRAAQVRERLAIGPAYHESDLVFCREDGSPLRPASLTQAFQRHARAAGLPRIRLHDLRHGWATLALELGIHPKVVSERLGHASINITLDTYSHVSQSVEADAAERVASKVLG